MGAASGIAGVGLAARWVDMPTFAAPVAAMIAIGVGIDYALLVVTRYREGLSAGLPTKDAIVLAQTTAGRSVLFAGVTVVIASLGLVLMDLKLITGVALGIAGSVLITMLAALTCCPPSWRSWASRIDRFSVRRRTARPDGDPPAAGAGRSRSARCRGPSPPAALLVAPEHPGARHAAGLLRRRHQAHERHLRGAPTTSSPTVSGPGPTDRSSSRHAATPAARRPTSRLADALGRATGVAGSVHRSRSAGRHGRAPPGHPADGPAGRGDDRPRAPPARRRSIPAGARASPSQVAVGGSTAAAVDFADYTAERLPIFLTVVLGLALLLLMAVFRGFPVAVKAVVVNLLSIGAAFGVVVAVFQWGWGVDLLDLGAAGPVEAWAPMMLIAIVFGLSMDYEVFLLSRIREEYERSGDNADAVAAGSRRPLGHHRGRGRSWSACSAASCWDRAASSSSSASGSPGRAHRRDRGAHGVGACGHGAARRSQLVAA